jgi:hypothetical protein
MVVLPGMGLDNLEQEPEGGKAHEKGTGFKGS